MPTVLNLLRPEELVDSYEGEMYEQVLIAVERR